MNTFVFLFFIDVGWAPKHSSLKLQHFLIGSNFLECGGNAYLLNACNGGIADKSFHPEQGNTLPYRSKLVFPIEIPIVVTLDEKCGQISYGLAGGESSVVFDGIPVQQMLNSPLFPCFVIGTSSGRTMTIASVE